MFEFLSNLFAGFTPNVHMDAGVKKEVAELTSELIRIGIKEDFLSERPGGLFNAQCHHRRTREIGTRLNNIAGYPLMWQVFSKVRRKVGKQLGEHLEYAWSDIGEWQA